MTKKEKKNNIVDDNLFNKKHIPLNYIEQKQGNHSAQWNWEKVENHAML